MKKIIKRFIIFFICLVRIDRLFEKRLRNKVLILYYHNIIDSVDNVRFVSKNDINYRLFFQEIHSLREHGYSFLTMDEYLNYKGTNLKKSVIITFDDGYKNSIKYALQIQELKGIFYINPGIIPEEKDNIRFLNIIEQTVVNNKIIDEQDYNFFKTYITNHFQWPDLIEFIILSRKTIKLPYTNRLLDISNLRKKNKCYNKFINKIRNINFELTRELLKKLIAEYQEDIINSISKQNLFLKNVMLASWKDLMLLDRTNWNIGLHTAYHTNIHKIKKEKDIKRELINPQIELKHRLDYAKSLHFSYPAGIVSKKGYTLIKESGYKSAVLVKKGFNKAHPIDFFQLKRIYGAIDSKNFNNIIRGLF